MPSNGTYRTKVPYREGAFKLGRAAGRKIATAVHRGLVSVGCQTVDTDNDEGGAVPKNAGGDAGKGEQVGIKPGCELMGVGRDAIRSRGSGGGGDGTKFSRLQVLYAVYGSGLYIGMGRPRGMAFK